MENKQIFLTLLLHTLSCGTQEVTVLVHSTTEQPVGANARVGTAGTLVRKRAKWISVLKRRRDQDGQKIGK